MDAAPEQERRFTLSKAERLKSRKAFSYLLEHGSSLRVGVLNVFYVFDPPADLCPRTALAAFSVSKRRFRRAVDRNLLKRRIREAYRLHQHILFDTLSPQERRLLLLFSYRHRDRLDYDRIRRSVVKALHLVLEAGDK